MSDGTGRPGVLTTGRLVKFALFTLPLVIAIAFLVGHYAARPETGSFDWELASIFGTAIGTTLLAIATGALAYTTTGDVRATWQLADLTIRAQQASIKPRFVDALGSGVMWSIAKPPGDIRVIVSVRNIGVGLALIQGDVTMHWEAPLEAVNPATYIGTATSSVVAPGEVINVEFRFDESARNRVDWIRELGRFSIEIPYVDSAGEQPEVTRIDVDRIEGEWRATAVSFRRADAEKPYASSGRHPVASS